MTIKRWLLAAVVTTVVTVATLVAVYTTSLHSQNTISGSTIPSKSTSMILYKTWGPWNYTVSINATVVNHSKSVLVVGILTYLGPSNATITSVTPFLLLSVYSSSGKLVWVFSPSQATFSDVIMFRGERRGLGACIPTSSQNLCIPPLDLQPGTYTIHVEPPFYSYSANKFLGDNLAVIANFTVR